MNTSSATVLLKQVFTALGPYREEILLIGGFAKTYYRLVPGFRDLGLIPLATNDVDLAMREPLMIRGGQRLHDALLAQGLVHHEIWDTSNRPAACRYYLPGTKRPLPNDPYVEFLVPLFGPESTKPSRPQQDELLAQAVRFADLLLAEPVTVQDPELGLLRIPHPLAFVIQKTRIRKYRKPAKQARDQADAFYVVISMRSEWEAWRDRWHDWSQRSETWASWLKTTSDWWTTLYKSPSQPGAKEVASSHQSISAELAFQVMSEFAQVVTGK
jgi:hypothetical protein